MIHLPVGERVLAILLFGIWLAMTLAYVLLPPDLHESKVANVAIGTSVLIVALTGVVLISRRQR